MFGGCDVLDIEKEVGTNWYIPGAINLKLIEDHGGDLIGNIHTGKLHEPGCRAIDMMKPEHIRHTDGDGFTPCGWCHGGSALNEFEQLTIDKFNNEDPEDIEICEDPLIEKLFQGNGCDSCSSHMGIVKIRPHEGGVRLLGRFGKWWVYFECFHCGYQTSLHKVKQHSQVKKAAIKV